MEFITTDNVLFVLNLSASASMTNGFRYIKDLLMQRHSYHLHCCYKTLLKNKINVATVKTDALTINKNDLEKAKTLLDFTAGTGNWRVSKTEDFKLPQSKWEMRENNEIVIEALKVNNTELTLQEEYDVDHLCNLFEEHMRVMVRAEYAGSGKSYCCEQMLHKGHKLSFVCPTHVSAQKYEENGITLNKFFSIGMTENSNIAKFDDNPYDTIVFDEIFFYNIKNLSGIKGIAKITPRRSS